ncbi:lambda phage type II restriction-modification system DNA N-6-adenine-methyltransferase Dam [Shewanella algicola]|uniref:Phage N-6-adenine-methyltransferase n=1 Tax=Shewanella algicola TaxID=640633 RepID=A0A9X1Z5H7_9GAMM|nr:phage N-6-adenine-methyltransferase [Shewanella algicola]MCL1103697.1 phage N-6-adenine-methyltransferase [Shewanella algicola]GGP37641.1 lambda phage type II restriction-modification system DNA N-6-adenine-methyltransferase Dam [Shewanella algicola]
MSQYSENLQAMIAKPAHYLKEVGDQWQTPPALFWGVFAKFGPFVLDLFTDGENNKCANYYTVEDNALVQDWAEDLNGGKAFANPPYSRSSYEDEQAITGMRNIIDKTRIERDKGAKVVYLIKSATSEVWWPEDADHVCFIRGRISFDLPAWFRPANKKQAASSAGFACAIAIFDKEWQGDRMGYINREDLLRDGKVLLDIINAAAYHTPTALTIKGTIETRPDDSEQGEQIDIEHMITQAKHEEATNSKWPSEVQYVVEEAFKANPNKFNDYRHAVLSEIANTRLLEKQRPSKIIAELSTMLERTEPMRATA